MSYMRGSVYIWADDERVHFWVADGDDGWEGSVWALGQESNAPPTAEPVARPSGVGLEQQLADAYVMMRLGQLIEEGLVETALARALAEKGNFGCVALEKRSEALRVALLTLADT